MLSFDFFVWNYLHWPTAILYMYITLITVQTLEGRTVVLNQITE